MELSTKIIRSQLNLFKPFVMGCSLETARKGQEKIGELTCFTYRADVKVKDVDLGSFFGAFIEPKGIETSGLILYLHGGGYTCGNISYAKGFSSALAVKCGIKVFCCAYRLAPENVYPAALDDALTAYEYLLSHGYRSNDIILCGESAGGGLIYSLCLKLKAAGKPLPAGIIGISPWTDLSSSGKSYEENMDKDPSMTKERLNYFANCYVHGKAEGIEDSDLDITKKRDPYVSPLFGTPDNLPPSLIFAGGDEIMLDDAVSMHEKLLAYGSQSMLRIAPKMWHAYLLYALKENSDDFLAINNFIDTHLHRKKNLRWMRLDNAAKIYPAAMSRHWSNIFRLSVNLNEDIDVSVLRSALEVTVKRFPSIAVRIRRGMFWYYLEEIPEAPEPVEERAFPLTRMSSRDMRKCAFRVITYKNRLAIELFHALTDGNGGLVFLKTLVAEYLTQKYGENIPNTCGVLDRFEPPKEEELTDSFQNCDLNVSASRKEDTAYKIKGTKESDSFCTDTAFIIDAQKMNAKAKEYGVTLTAFLTSVFMKAVLNLQNENVTKRNKKKPVKILVPVNLRAMYGSSTLRNFVLYVTPGIDPRLGSYSF
ncbi:MAG: alpha/beta hydrolase, partial [Ruminococcaceae bacterium]|nr:alpha/beta hydrolase [Oscillospiraceae bacterium]